MMVTLSIARKGRDGNGTDGVMNAEFRGDNTMRAKSSAAICATTGSDSNTQATHPALKRGREPDAP